MLGALTFLPTFMQFVDGVSATSPACARCRWSRACCITSIGSGNIVGRTGRYKMFPVAGTAIMAVGVRAAVPDGRRHAHLAAVGVPVHPRHRHRPVHAGPDPGRAEHLELRRPRRGDVGCHVLPDHRKFLRRSDFRLAVRQLPRRPDRAGAGRQRRTAARPRSRRRRCTRCHRRWPRPSSTPTPTRWAWCSCARSPSPSSGSSSRSSSRRCRCARWTRSRRPTSARASACRVRNRPRRSSRWPSGGCSATRRRSGCAASPSSPAATSTSTQLWALLQIYRQNQVFGSATLTDIAERLRVPHEVIEPTFDGLVDNGLALRTGGQLWLTQAGDEAGRRHLGG